MANAFDINDTIETDILDEHMSEDETDMANLIEFADGGSNYVPKPDASSRGTTPRVVGSGSPKGRRKRTESQMKASFKGDPLSEAAYVRRRIASLEEKISQLLTCATPEARDLILNTKALEHLKRYY
jgi:hypothetical protein